MNRIKSAGGFVNNVGRINGNLNLSRYNHSSLKTTFVVPSSVSNEEYY